MAEPSGFHPIIRRWFAETLGEPTPAQVRGWASIRAGGHTLIAAPTGSGKTLAAFLNAIDELFREGLERGALPDEVRVVYVSPLKALSADIHKNLAEPRRQIGRLAESAGLPPVRITAAVRTGDTPAAERAAMLRSPPHILVTTPESLYLLLTAERTREMLRTVRTVIVDEIHAVIESRRGAHLSLSLERLEHVACEPLQRIGLSATQKPIETVARYLAGLDADGEPRDCTMIDEGHFRDIDLALELPGSSLEAVMAGEVWQEVFERLVALIGEHRTTLVFVNTRRLAERVAGALSERLGEDAVTAHHGSLSKAIRLDAEERLKHGRLRALVATSSLELGIDIGHVDLVVQLGSPRRIAAFLQRVGRSGHTVRGRPKGRLFPLTRDDLVECAALIDAVRRGELDHLVMQDQPLDVLAQQLTAETSAEDWPEDALYELVCGAYPYRALTREVFDQVLEMLARGYSTRRGRRAALVHRDVVHRRVRGRRGSRHIAIASGGAIPEIADYRVELDPEGTFVGTLNEDFAIESSAGDVFQLGNTSWRILRVLPGVVRVADAHGEPPTIPFWLGEAPTRSDDLSQAVSRLRARIDALLDEVPEGDTAAAAEALAAELGLTPTAAEQIVQYLGEAKRLLGALPTHDTLILERFFDEAGGMQLVLHSPFGGRVNRAWGLALRKKFCRTFNFELQAAATDDGLLLSLGPQHSFPLDDVFRYLHPNTVRDTLIQAVLDAPLFQTRWRWNATLSLAVQRNRHGRKVPPQIQRMQAEDLLAAVFPDAAACLENIAGDREVPDHPLVTQALADCLEEAMDLPQLEQILRKVHAGEMRLLACDTPEPSPLSHEILNARPYAFLDPAPLEERRTQAVYTRRALEPTSAADLGALDAAAIERVRAEARVQAENIDEMHDALLTLGFLREDEITDARWPAWLRALEADGRAARLHATGAPSDAGTERDSEPAYWLAIERVSEWCAVHPRREAIASSAAHGDRSQAVRDLLRSRLEVIGPATARQLADSLRASADDVEAALIAIEAEGVILRGSFTPGRREREWCDRRLLARIHRCTLNRLRAEIQPVSAADFMRFLFHWQRVEEERRSSGLDGLAAVIGQLEGFEVPAVAWEGDVLPARCGSYSPDLLDALCLSGRAQWCRLSQPANPAAPVNGLLRSSPIALLFRSNASIWIDGAALSVQLSPGAVILRDVLSQRGACFFPELVRHANLSADRVEEALGELVAAGLVTADSFAGLRALLAPASNGSATRNAAYRVDTAGRWSLLPCAMQAPDTVSKAEADARIEQRARTLLSRYGVVFRRIPAREPQAPAWRDLVRVYRRLEARGEIRGGRFVDGFAGEQFALPEAVGMLRAVRREVDPGTCHAISAADPLNLTGIVTPGPRVPALAGNRVLYRAGVPVAALVAGRIHWLERSVAEAERPALEQRLRQRRVPPQLRGYLRPRSGRPSSRDRARV